MRCMLPFAFSLDVTGGGRNYSKSRTITSKMNKQSRVPRKKKVKEEMVRMMNIYGKQSESVQLSE